MIEQRPERRYEDFWGYWQTQFLEDGRFDEKYIVEEFQRLRETSLNEDVWPEGANDYKRYLKPIFKQILGGDVRED